MMYSGNITRVLTRDTGSIIQMLTGQVEMCLLELVGHVGDDERSSLGDNLDRRSQVLKLGTLGKVGYLQLEIRGRNHLEGPIHHIDGRLLGPGSAYLVDRGVQGDPVKRTL
jgi:hypothetical protein